MRARVKIEGRGNQPQATEGLPNLIPARRQPPDSMQEGPFFISSVERSIRPVRIHVFVKRQHPTRNE